MAPKEIKRQECQIYSRVNGWFTPIHTWNPGKRSEWNDRVTYDKQLDKNN